jgi:hypothetical protein
MRPAIASLILACVVSALPIAAAARPHHARRPAVVAARPPLPLLRLAPVADGGADEREASVARIGPRAIAGDRIPVSAIGHFGHGGAASIGYESGAAASLIGAHELNAAFSSQPFSPGGVVGGGVNLPF